MGNSERTPREATISPASHGLSRELRMALRGLAKHCGAEKDRPGLHRAYRVQYDGRSWLTATDGYRALFVADGWHGLDVSGLGDDGLDGILSADLRQAVKGKLHDGAVTVPVSGINYGGPNVVGCIPPASAAVTVERNHDRSGELFIVAGHDAAGYARSIWHRVGVPDIGPTMPLAVRTDQLGDMADALNTQRLILGYQPDRPLAPVLVRAQAQHVGIVDGFGILMPVRIA